MRRRDGSIRVRCWRALSRAGWNRSRSRSGRSGRKASQRSASAGTSCGTGSTSCGASSGHPGRRTRSWRRSRRGSRSRDRLDAGQGSARQAGATAIVGSCWPTCSVGSGAVGAVWIDLLDPSEAELREKAPRELEESALQLLLRPHIHQDEPRPTMQGHGAYVFGVFLTATYVESRQEIFYPEVDLVITHETILTVRKTPVEHCPPFDITQVQQAVKKSDLPGMIAYRLVDEIAEQYLDLIDAVDEK